MTTKIDIEHCKNCEVELKGDFCSKCGNPKALKRIDGKYILSEVGSVLNFDKGISYTIKELLLRPGNTVREFILNDRKRLVKPIIFVIFSSLFFVIIQQILGFNTGTTPQNIESPGVMKAFEWVGENFGVVNILLGVFIGFWIRLFFIKSSFNIYEIFILVFFTIGIGNLIFALFGILESVTGFESYNLTYFVAMLYSAWAIGNFFDKKNFLSYFKGLLAYIFGTTTGSFLIVIIGVLIDFLNKIS
ncbi:DUF3667 domain-containing protein [Aquimarina sp. AU474]|uniref:DUF3667 domain-containing protein n=1 Tax=Aquimarina sp. AU474 TaxID=2108529 RepID=UPI000D69487E|nr:DUF3667 domain-containing protein [Aquimarina sp. AU474]